MASENLKCQSPVIQSPVSVPASVRQPDTFPRCTSLHTHVLAHCTTPSHQSSKENVQGILLKFTLFKKKTNKKLMNNKLQYFPLYKFFIKYI